MSILKQRLSAPDLIVNDLKNRIRNGEFRAGEQLPSERQLQTDYGVSRLPLREAIARLNGLGIIRVSQGKGAFVCADVDSATVGDALIPLFPHDSIDRMHELVEARSLIEGEAASRAAQYATVDQLKSLESKLNYTQSILKDPKLFAECDFAFHREIAEISGNRFLILMLEALSSHIRHYLSQLTTNAQDRAKMINEHEGIYRAIKKGDPVLACKKAREHLVFCKNTFQRSQRKRNRTKSA
ncbi:MAG: FadR/GntR family transcriptional regulator [Puniceicoccaceae bacterium]